MMKKRKSTSAGMSELPPAKAGRGGYLQRMAATTATGSTSASSDKTFHVEKPECALSALLNSEVLWGDLSAKKAQKYAAAAIESGVACAYLRSNSQCGNQGGDTGHI